MKYALFDTDFISKTHTVRLDEENHIIDRILEMPEYIFYCHEHPKHGDYCYWNGNFFAFAYGEWHIVW